MGKKISRNHEKKKQLNSLIKVLRPKVYITDSSSFKRLVQELTGNGNSSTVSSPPDAAYIPDQTTVDKIAMVTIEDGLGEPESSLEASSDASTDSSFELCNRQVLFPEYSHQTYSQIYLQGEYNLLMNQQEDDFLAYGELESWLLDTEPYPLCNSFNQIQQEVSIYDYELSGLI